MRRLAGADYFVDDERLFGRYVTSPFIMLLAHKPTDAPGHHRQWLADIVGRLRQIGRDFKELTRLEAIYRIGFIETYRKMLPKLARKSKRTANLPFKCFLLMNL